MTPAGTTTVPDLAVGGLRFESCKEINAKKETPNAEFPALRFSPPLILGLRYITDPPSLVAFSRAFARLSFATVNQNRIHQPVRPEKKGGEKKIGFLRKRDFLECRGKSRNLTSGLRFSESARSIFPPYGVQIKGVMEKGWIFDEKY